MADFMPILQGNERKMVSLHKISVFVACVFTLGMLAGCDEPDGPAERAAEAIDETVEELAEGGDGPAERAGERIDDTVEGARDRLDDTSD